MRRPKTAIPVEQEFKHCVGNTGEKKIYDTHVRMLLMQGRAFNEIYIRGSKEIWIEGKPHIRYRNDGANLERQYKKFLPPMYRAVRECLDKYLDKNGQVIEKIPLHESISSWDIKRYDEIPNKGHLVWIDLDSGYWQAAYKLGYISKSLYMKYVFQDDFKRLKQMSLAFLRRPTRAIYHDGKGGKREIVCDNLLHNIAYHNIRATCIQTMVELSEFVGDGLIGRKVDSIHILPECAAMAKRFLMDKGWMFKSELCPKSDVGYWQEGYLKFPPRNNLLR
jgi:hypothetical protein